MIMIKKEFDKIKIKIIINCNPLTLLNLQGLAKLI